MSFQKEDSNDTVRVSQNNVTIPISKSIADLNDQIAAYFTHIFFSFFLAFLQTSYRFILIKTFKLHYFYLPLYSGTTDRGEITFITTFISGLDLCSFPCFKYI